MSLVISVHEYQLRSGVSNEQFEAAVENARSRGLFNLPGLVEYHFLRRIRGTRKADYAAIWIYESKNSWIKLWGTPENPLKKEDYPEKWNIWENEFLAPLLTVDPDHIYFSAYEEF
jgi:hypothetical protein